MKKIFKILQRIIILAKENKIVSVISLIVVLGLIGFVIFKTNSTSEVQAFSVVQKVDRGTVSSGIETTGEIVAAQKLDLDVYKQLARIDVVNIQNGSHVEEDDVLISFDKSDANVDVRSSAVSVTEAELDLQNTRENFGDESTQIRTLENQIKEYEKSIEDAYLNFLNADIKIEPATSSTENKVRPIISGTYMKDENQYRILVDAPDFNDRYEIESLLIYSVFDNTGKISEHELIYDIATPIADTGLYITFTSAMNPEEVDKWKMLFPNTEIFTYSSTKSDYEETVRALEVSLENTKQELTYLQQTDSAEYRNLNVEQAELALIEAQQRLAEDYDSIKERDIIAPFAGSVQDMENVVVGATPTGGTEDSISLGTLVSDEYLVTFTLDAADVAKISVGQKVEVTVTSYSNQPEFEAEITEISSLPTSSGVAQYDVKAKLNYDAKTAETILREGMLADVVIIQEEKEDVLRVSTSAISYKQGQPTVQVVDSLTEEQQQQFEMLGIVRTENSELATYSANVELGVEGRFYVELLSGLEEGTLILDTVTTIETTKTTVQNGFGGAPPGGLRENGGSNSPSS